ncbi:MAG TPA: 3-deoxy-7-phosphoheptulonate synthase [Fimbriimonadaceae bacterium]|nr:3-deoxy-7-phosphoheptulonate synthase [Fimbriimonadaceae bacterium]
MRQTDDLRILDSRPLVPPGILLEELPITDRVAETVAAARAAIAEIVHGRDRRLVAVVGPCSIHDISCAIDYGDRLSAIASDVADRVLVVMRAYFEKPRTSVGWKGFVNDPNLDETFQINKGLRLARRLLLELNEMGLPTGSEFLDLHFPQHLADLTSWVAIGARTTESQVHRELASGLSMPVGFKNTTEGSVGPAIDAVSAARNPHWFPSVTKQSVAALFQTTGNPDCHVILRGGSRTGPNFHADAVVKTAAKLEARGLPTRLMIDCSHGNSRKDHHLQGEVLDDIAGQVRGGSEHIMGVMIESHLLPGRQDVVNDKPLVYGQSITDACISIVETRELLCRLADAVPG